MAYVIQKAGDKAIKDAFDFLVSGKMFNFDGLTANENQELSSIIRKHVPSETKDALSKTGTIVIEPSAPEGAPANAVAYVTSADVEEEAVGSHIFHVIAPRLCSVFSDDIILKTICATLNGLVISPHEIGHIDDLALQKFKSGEGSSDAVYLPEHSAEGAEPPEEVISVVAKEVHSFLQKVAESKVPTSPQEINSDPPEDLEDLIKESRMIHSRSKESFRKLKNIFVSKWL